MYSKVLDSILLTWTWLIPSILAISVWVLPLKYLSSRTFRSFDGSSAIIFLSIMCSSLLSSSSIFAIVSIRFGLDSCLSIVFSYKDIKQNELSTATTTSASSTLNISASSFVVGAGFPIADNLSVSLLIFILSCFIARLILISPSSLKNLLISPAIIGTA